MCNVCEGKETLITEEFMQLPCSWSTSVEIKDIYEIPYVVMIDRGFIRLVQKDDSQCMDNGEKRKIKHCPECGKKLWGGHNDEDLL